MKRIMLLLTVAATMSAMVVLTASGAVAQDGGGGPPSLEAYCNDVVHGSYSTGPPTCTYTGTIAGVPAQHGFTRTTSQVYTLTIMQWPGGIPGSPVGMPIESCQNPAGRDVPLDNPNCTVPS